MMLILRPFEVGQKYSSIGRGAVEEWLLRATAGLVPARFAVIFRGFTDGGDSAGAGRARVFERALDMRSSIDRKRAVL